MEFISTLVTVSDRDSWYDFFYIETLPHPCNTHIVWCYLSSRHRDAASVVADRENFERDMMDIRVLK